MMQKEDSIAASMVYKTLERFSIMAFQMIVQIVIARILCPEDYGIVAMMTVFINVASVFIHTGFNMAVVQKKEADNIDFSTALTLNFLIGLFLYAVIFFTAPFLASFYNQPLLTDTFRVLALILPIGSISSIQSAIATRRMHFRKLFFCNVTGSVVSGIIGVAAALLGFGCWALIVQQLSSVIVVAVALTIHASWKPSFAYSSKSASEMFGFGWKLLAAGLLNSVYNELNSLIIGKKYTSADLAFYTKGKTFPSSVTFGIDSALQSVTLSAFSRKQTDLQYLHQLIHKTLISNSFILMPCLIILGVVASPLTSVLLTDKWLPIVPYMQICCLTYAFHPMASVDMQVIAAVGRSDMRLKLEFIKKPIGLLLLILAMPYGPMAIAVSAALTSIISLLVGMIASSKIIKYSVLAHFEDIMPALLISIVSGLAAYLVKFIQIDFSPICLLIVQCLAASFVYLTISYFLKIEALKIYSSKISNVISRLRK